MRIVHIIDLTKPAGASIKFIVIDSLSNDRPHDGLSALYYMSVAYLIFSASRELNKQIQMKTTNKPTVIPMTSNIRNHAISAFNLIEINRLAATMLSSMIIIYNRSLWTLCAN